MKISNRELLFFYAIAICISTIYTLTSINECEAYWMHDASINITKQKLLLDIIYFFVLPILTLFVQRLFKTKTQSLLFLTHFLIALTSILLLILAINKPCDNINGGHYMFINSTMTLGYYLLKLTCFIILFIIISQTIRSRKLSEN
jgi:hypothetical protein